MKVLLAILFLFASFFSSAQAKKVPKSFTKSVKLIAIRLTEDERKVEKKVEAIYEWITENIEFDYASLQKGEYPIVQNPEAVLKSKKAISPGYVELMRAMLEVVGIESEPVSGYIHDMHWFPGKLVVQEGHVWIAVNINGNWKFADPAWDAGYIGRVPKKVKPYKPKKYLINKWKKPEKEERKLKEREKKEEERKRKHDEKPSYTNKIGFVSEPEKDFFFMERDTFLLSHVPTLPMWQMRNVAISLESFSKSEDSLIMDIEANVGKKCNPLLEIESYQDKDYFEQLITLGEDGYKYNPHNPWLKVHYYYEFMALVHNRKLQKLARGSVYEITESKYGALAARADTILKYGKMYKTVEKNWFKEDKTFDKEQYKISDDRDKVNSKLTKKVVSEYGKMSAKLVSNAKTIEKNTSKLSTLKGKINKSYAKSMDYKMPDDFDTTIVNTWVTEIRKRTDQIERRSEELSKLHSNSAFNTILSDVSYINKLLFYNEHYIKVNSYSTSEWVAEVDSLIKQESNHFLSVMSDSITKELLGKELMDELRVIEEIGKTAKVELNQLKAEGKIRFPYKYELYLQSMYVDAIRMVEKTNGQNLNFNEEVRKALKSEKTKVNEIETRMKKQDELKEKNHEYIAEMTEKEHERSVNFMKDIEAAAKAWKKKYSVK